MEHNLSMGRFHRVASSLSTHQYVCPLWLRASARCGRGAAEDVDVAGLENLNVDVSWVDLGDEGGDVADSRAVVAVLAVEDDVLGLGVAAIADPEGVGADGERREQVQGGLHGGAVGHFGHG